MSSSRHIGAAGLAAVAVAFGFARYGYGLFLPVLRSEFGLSTEWLGVIASGAYAAYLVALLVTGLVVARLGPRIPVVLGGLSAAVGMALVATARNPTMLATGLLMAATSAGWTWAPYADAVDRLVRADRQSRVLAVISTGTTFGLLVAGPAALLFEGAWRLTWAAFAVSAAGVTAWNAWLLRAAAPAQAPSHRPRLRWSWFLCARSGPLFLLAFVFGLVAAVYYTYAVDVVSSAGLPSVYGPVLWTAVGVAGLTGLATGSVVERIGLRRALAACSLTLAAGIGLLAVAPGWPPVAITSALVYGAAYMPMSAVMTIWSSRVFSEQPATGLSATVLVLAIGAIVGPALAAVLAAQTGLAAAFLLAAGITVPLSLLRPSEPRAANDAVLVGDTRTS